MIAYLVIREGSKWTDVFRLIPGRTVTVGRAPTNEIVVKDERCSRNHAEIFLTRGQWTLRDLESRNGTLIGERRIQGDCPLEPGDIIRIAHYQLAFVHDLSKAFSDSSAPVNFSNRDEEETISARLEQSSLSDSNVLEMEPCEPETIIHRRGQTRFLEPREANVYATPKVGRAATKLCRLAFDLANQGDVVAVANLALEGLFESTTVDAGAVLLLPSTDSEMSSVADLELVASRSDIKPSYHRVSSFLAETVIREGEAVLARNIEDDSMLGSQDSKGEILSTSVICAPIRQGQKVLGIIHLYSTDANKTPDPDDLEFTLAVADNVALALKNITRQQELTENLSLTQDEIRQLRNRLGAENEIVGSSPALAKVQQEISRAAPTRATILIRGENGVGKELVARAIHFQSPQKKGPFVCLNCAALSESLLESELFGHERGAFTGATERKIGKFEAAHQGTLMLDEIGEMSPSIQAKFLRVLEGHPFERLGGSQAIKVEVRVISATNRDLEKAIEEGTYRRDLYFRLRVLEILVPPLRKRQQDVVELANHYLNRFNIETGRKISGFTREAILQMQQYRWPGNVRELKNVIERAVVLAPNDLIQVDDLSLTTIATASESGEVSSPYEVYQPASISEIERRHILQTLNAVGWNKSRAATILGIERSTLDRKIHRYELAQK